MAAEHDAAVDVICKNKASWTSHSVIVVDQSGSMNTKDVAGVTRSCAVWWTVAVEFVGEQLRQRSAQPTDVVSVIAMQESSSVVLEAQPMDWILYNALLALSSSKPCSHGNYLPALDLAESLLMTNSFGACALSLLFLSDGRPSDRVWKGAGPAGQQHVTMVTHRMETLASHFGRRLNVSAIGVGNAPSEFMVLKEMSATASDYGSISSFRTPSLDSLKCLGSSISWLTSSLTSTKAEMTRVGSATQREVRNVVREKRTVLSVSVTQYGWHLYGSKGTWQDGSLTRRVVWDKNDRDWVSVNLLSQHECRGIAMRKPIFAEGAERIVHKFYEVDSSLKAVGLPMVAKESRFVEDLTCADRIEFHRTFCETQVKAQLLADDFNARLQAISLDASLAPRIQFLESSVYIVEDAQYGQLGFLVERMLDTKSYPWTKWNGNAGYVLDTSDDSNEPPAKRRATRVSFQMNPIVEELPIEECEDESLDPSVKDEEDEQLLPPLTTLETGPWKRFLPQDVLQSFTHYSYRRTGRRMLVCDLQGIYNSSKRTYELTDPVIHYASRKGRTRVFGRTDHGKKGMQDFFKTHKCNGLCCMLGIGSE